MIITIDGPAGTGKSTVAKKLAKRLQFTYFDTGALYRTITWAELEYGIAVENAQTLKDFLQKQPIAVHTHLHEKRYFLGTVDVTELIRTPKVTREVSRISAQPAVRATLVQIQRTCADQEENAVFEGRDMGTVVFPRAELKIFLTASPAVRAKRRHKELVSSQIDTATPFEKVLEEIEKRDMLDSSRDISPMKPAEDAVIIDTSDLTIEEVVDTIMQLLKEME